MRLTLLSAITATVCFFTLAFVIFMSLRNATYIRRNVVPDSDRPIFKNEDSFQNFLHQSYLIGNVWPKVGDLNDRILNQLSFIEEYANYKSRPTRKTSQKIILRIGEVNFGNLNWRDGNQSLIKENCPITDCWFTSDISAARYADALVISEMNETTLPKLTPKPNHQIWIAQHQESPRLNFLDPEIVSNLINWSASVRAESTFAIPYAFWVKSEDMKAKKIDYAKGKTRKVAWMVSHCRDRNGRLEYVRELSKFIDVDIYGQCGNMSCPKKNPECFELLKQYKFYLAFENSNCAGYITEKFHWNALRSDVIPVVMGARPEDYEAIAPGPDSFIHVDDFDGPKQLADYLKVLDRDDALYNRYFQYKNHYKYTTRQLYKYWCRICAFLHLRDDVNYVHWYENYPEWWNGACYSSPVQGKPWRTWKGATPGKDLYF